MDIVNILGLVLAGVLTAAIIAGVIWLGKKGYIAGVRTGRTLKDWEDAEKDIETAKRETLNEAQKAELGNMSKYLKSVSVEGKAPSICPSCKAKPPDWKNIEYDNKGFNTEKHKYKYQCDKCNYSNLYEHLHT